jgi:hypothetical protein
MYSKREMERGQKSRTKRGERKKIAKEVENQRGG